MGCNKYKVILTNGTFEDDYIINAFNEEEATILAQAEAIKQAKGHKLVSVKEII